MNTVVSTDGTTIAFDWLGEGPPVALVCGASVDRSSSAPLAELLAADFTVFNFDRRGRGDSGDTPAVRREREIEAGPRRSLEMHQMFGFGRLDAPLLDLGDEVASRS